MEVCAATDVPDMRGEGEVGIDGDTKILAFVYRRENSVANNKRERRNKVRTVFGGDVHEDAFVDVWFHTVESEPRLGGSSPRRQNVEGRRAQ